MLGRPSSNSRPGQRIQKVSRNFPGASHAYSAGTMAAAGVQIERVPCLKVISRCPGMVRVKIHSHSRAIGLMHKLTCGTTWEGQHGGESNTSEPS